MLGTGWMDAWMFANILTLLLGRVSRPVLPRPFEHTWPHDLLRPIKCVTSGQKHEEPACASPHPMPPARANCNILAPSEEDFKEPPLTCSGHGGSVRNDAFLGVL